MARPLKKLGKRMYILCEGEKTEPFYLEGYIMTFAKDKANVIEIPDIKCNTPIALVNEAIKLKDSKRTSSGDEFWVVYDREGVTKYTNELHNQARQKAISHDIKIALSNICFEFWLLQHFGYRNTPYTSCADLLKNSPLKADLSSIGIANYEKNQAHIFSKLQPFVDKARHNSKRLNKESFAISQEGAKPHMLSSYTDIYLLLDAIDAFET